MLRVVDDRRLRLVVPVPEAYMAGIAAGTAVSFTVPAYPGQTFSGVVARIAQAVDVKTRTMAVELDVANADGRLAPGHVLPGALAGASPRALAASCRAPPSPARRIGSSSCASATA